MTVKDNFWKGMDTYISSVINAFAEINKRSDVFITDMKTDITWWSERMMEYLGLSDAYICDTMRFSSQHIHPEDLELFRSGFERRLQGLDCDKELEYRVLSRDGVYNLFTVSTKLLYDEKGEARYFIGTLINQGISVEIDAITSLHNTAAFTRYLEQKINNEETQLALLKIGIDSFSHINVMYGSHFADGVMRKVADELKQILKDKGYVYRVNGAKFIIVFEGIQREELIQMSMIIQERVTRHIKIDGRRVPLKISAGGILLDGYSGDVDTVKRRLTYAFNHSRKKHHGSLVIFNDEVRNGDDVNLDLIKIIHQSVLEGCDGFYLCYQPIVEAQTGRLIGMEALVRWEKEPYGKVPPGMFIEWLEEDPCMYELGKWILHQAIMDAKKIIEKIPDFFVNVNISASQIERTGFREVVVDILNETGFPKNQLCLELTERCREMDMSYLKNQIDFFRENSIRIAVDDFGTGSASFGMVSALAIDELKIDMSFVKNIQQHPRNQAIVKSIINMANETNMNTCIEGVENHDLVKYLKGYDATWHQGYFYSRPVPIREFMEMVNVFK